MPAISAGDLATLRTRPHRVQWYLAVAPYGDATFTAQVNDAGAARGDMTITYDTDVGEATVSAGMTLWVGSVAGGRDMGAIRIRSINVGANTISVAENDHIEWADDLHLTCPGDYGFREIWGKYQRQTFTPPDIVTFFNDYDLAFTAPADTVIPPKANAGAPVCAWIDPVTGNADVSFAEDGNSFTVEAGAAIASYLWDFADGAVIAGNVAAAGTCAVPNVVRWNVPGFRYISLTVTDNTAQARTAIVYVPVWIFEAGVEDPYTEVEITSQRGSPDGGWSCGLRVFQTDTAAEDIIYSFPDGALVVVFTRTWYDGIEDEIDSEDCHRQNIRFAGWLSGETLKFNWDDGWVEFEATSHDGVLRRIPGNAFSMESVVALSTDWYEIQDLNVDKAVHFTLENHSTANQVCHIETVGEGANRDMGLFRIPDASIYGQVQGEILRWAQCLLLSDRQGIIRATQDPQFLDVAGRVGVDVVCTLLQSNPNVQADWMGNMDAGRALIPRVGYVRLGGIAGETPFLSQAPGAAPRQQQNSLSLERCILQGQAEANSWSGLAFTQANNDYIRLPISLSGYWPVFDPAFEEYVQLTTTDPLSRVAWTNQKFVVREVEFTDLPGPDQTATTQLVLEKVNDILTGETVIIPDAPLPEPPGPPTPPIDPPSIVPDWTGPIKACVAWTQTQVAYTVDLLEHHTLSAATAGTGGVALHDTTVDFVSLGVAVGDTVENLTSGAYEHTTVAAIVSATQLTLTANINLVNTNEYQICGAQWVDIDTLPFTGSYLQFIWVQSSASTAGAWMLTTTNVYYTPNILTPAPVWVVRLTLAAMRALTGNANASFKGIAGWIEDPSFVIVNVDNNTTATAAASRWGAVYTNNLGLAWGVSDFNTVASIHWLAWFYDIEVEENSGDIWCAKGAFSGTNIHKPYMYRSVNKGVNFTQTGAIRFAEWLNDDSRGDIYVPYNTPATAYVAVNEQPQANRQPMKSINTGLTFAQIGPPGGYTATMARRGGANGWWNDSNDFLAFFIDGVGHWTLHRSGDGGTTWTEIGDEDDLFPFVRGGYAGGYTVIAETWKPEQQTLVWTAAIPSQGPTHNECRIRFTDDDGGVGQNHWSNMMGNWYAIFGDWLGASGSSAVNGNVGCIPLPRIGSNSYP